MAQYLVSLLNDLSNTQKCDNIVVAAAAAATAADCCCRVHVVAKLPKRFTHKVTAFVASN